MVRIDLNDSRDELKEYYRCLFPYIERFTCFEEEDPEGDSLAYSTWKNMTKKFHTSDIQSLILNNYISDSTIKFYINDKILRYNNLYYRKVWDRFREKHNIIY